MKPKKIDAIVSLDPTARVVVRNRTKVDWLDSNPNNISEDAIQNKWDELLAEYESKQYKRDRASSYPPLAEQLDILYHGGVNALKAELKKTKDKYPKP